MIQVRGDSRDSAWCAEGEGRGRERREVRGGRRGLHDVED